MTSVHRSKTPKCVCYYFYCKDMHFRSYPHETDYTTQGFITFDRCTDDMCWKIYALQKYEANNKDQKSYKHKNYVIHFLNRTFDNDYCTCQAFVINHDGDKPTGNAITFRFIKERHIQQ